MTVNDDSFTNWKNREEIAESMIPIIGKLHRERDVTILLHSRSLVNKSVVSILKTHRFARQIAGEELSVTETLPFLQALTTLDLGPSQIDIGMLAATYKADDRGLSVEEFTADAVIGATGENKIERRESDATSSSTASAASAASSPACSSRRPARATACGCAPSWSAGGGEAGPRQARLAAAARLHPRPVPGHDHGRRGEQHDRRQRQRHQGDLLRTTRPTVDYTAYGIKDAILIDNTGKWRDREGLSKHLRPGIAKVVLTAPGKGDVPNIVHGVNHDTIKPDEQILSCASCTTNAIVPPLKAMADEYGVLRGHVETVHSFTNDQNLLDNYHKADRRGRSAALNMVITETGAASAVAKALPDLEATITGSSIRVPGAGRVDRDPQPAPGPRDHPRGGPRPPPRRVAAPRRSSARSTSPPPPTRSPCDFIGSRHASIVDAGATKVEGDNAILYLWYDNEFGYSCQVIRVVQHVSGVEYPTYPVPVPVA